MAFITWSEELSVNIPEIDEEHKHLIELINHLHDAMSQGRGKQALSTVLDELIEYAKTHFVHEENLMTRANFQGLAGHKKEHDSFTRQVMEHQKRFTAGEVAITVEVSNFLKDWLIHHVRGVDKAYSSALRQNMGME